MKRFCLLISFIFFTALFPLNAHALSVSAEFACVIEAQTGRIIYEKTPIAIIPWRAQQKL